MRHFTYHVNPRFEFTRDGELICHCAHCGARRVPSLQIRRWLAQAERIVLPGLDGLLVITRSRSRCHSGCFGILTCNTNLES
jgi:hypothetical protein